MKKPLIILFQMAFALVSFAQIDTVLLTEKAAQLFPSFPVKSSYTSLFDKRNGKDFVYSANMESGLGIYDISNTSTLSLVLNVATSSFHNLDVSTVEQKGNSLFVGIGDFQVNTNASSGLAILDITNPASPTIKDIWDSTLFDHGISHLLIEGNYAYLSTMKDGIIILDISNENNIKFKSRLQLDLSFPSPSSNAHNARGLKYKNDSLYVCFDRGGLRVIDVSNKSNPLEAYKYINGTLNSQAAAAYNDIAIKGHYAFVSVDYCGLEVLDISVTPFTSVQWYNPWGCNTTNWSGAALHTNEVMLANNDSLLFVSAGQSDLFVFDVSNPLNTHKIGCFTNVNDSLATHGLDVWKNKVILSFIHTPFHIPPFTPFFADPGGLKLLSYDVIRMITALDENAEIKDQLTVFPNPGQNSKIQLRSTSVIVGLKLFNSLGQTVFIDKDIHKEDYTLDMASNETGVYLLSVETRAGITTRKIVIE